MIRLDSLTKIFDTPGGSFVAVDHVTLELGRGEICILLGPSGCGKTTTLKMINRIIEPTSGRIFIDGKDTTDADPVELRRSIGYVIQQIGLFPNMTVEENVCVVPQLLGWDRAKARARAMELLEMVALDPKAFAKRYPNELSGGQAQRVGVARALAADPPVMLMDEPFGAIDPINREVIQDEFLKMQEKLGKTILFVSHDIDEAIKMGDKVAIFRNGKIEQFGTPDQMLAHPANGFIADFVGSDRTLKRLRLIRIAEAMQTDAPRVRADDPVATAIALMDERGHDSIVMVGPRGRARGYLRRADLDGRGGTCGEHQTPLPGVVKIHEDLRAAVSTMFTHDLTWLACVDEDGFYKGYITQRDITHLLGQTYRDTPRVPA
jgi:osmoprotectant transport system ATP-binding protein